MVGHLHCIPGEMLFRDVEPGPQLMADSGGIRTRVFQTRSSSPPGTPPVSVPSGTRFQFRPISGYSN